MPVFSAVLISIFGKGLISVVKISNTTLGLSAFFGSQVSSFLGIFQFQYYCCLRVFIAWGFLAHAFLSLPPKQVSEPIPRGGNTLELEQLDQKCTACFTLFCTLSTASLSGTQVVEQVPSLFYIRISCRAPVTTACASTPPGCLLPQESSLLLHS